MRRSHQSSVLLSHGGPTTLGTSQTAPSQVKRAMRRIFHEKRKNYEKTCRLAAAEILLDSQPLPMDVINILLATGEMETETATFLLRKVQSSLRAPHHPARWVWSKKLPFSP